MLKYKKYNRFYKKVLVIYNNNYYFDNRSNKPIIKNGYIQQQNGHLKNYALVIPIRMKIKKMQ